MPDVKLKNNEMLSVVDTGSVVTGANAAKTLPAHKVEAKTQQAKGVVYVSADGWYHAEQGTSEWHCANPWRCKASRDSLAKL